MGSWRKDLIRVARGDAPADLVLKGGQVANVFTGEVYPADVAIVGPRIAAVGADLSGLEEVDASGHVVAPGFIDAHVHVESSLLTPSQFARVVVPRGVTTVVTDPHEIGNVHGLDGIRFMVADAAEAPFDMFVNAPSCVPATAMETSGATLDAAALASLRGSPGVLGLAEVMNFPGVVAGDPAMLAKLDAFTDTVIDGHCPGLSGPALNAYVAAGPRSDHEATTADEAREKLRLGMYVYLREATNAHNLRVLLPALDEATARRLCLCTDDRTAGDLLDEGSIDHLLRMCVEEGVPPVTALTLATLNPAEAFGLHDRGAVAPGRLADLVVLPSLGVFRPRAVLHRGRIVARDGELIVPSQGATFARKGASVRVDPDSVDLTVRAAGRRVRVIGAVPNQLVTTHDFVELTRAEATVEADPASDRLKMAVVERHGINGRVGLGFVHGVGLRRGALAGTVAHDHHNLVVIGCDDASMRTAMRAVADAGGGLAVADGDDLRAVVALPIAGLMSERAPTEVRGAVDRAIAAARALGATAHDPFMAMSFLALEVIPSLKLTDAGLVDVDAFDVVPLFADD